MAHHHQLLIPAVLLLALTTSVSAPLEDRGDHTYDPNTNLEWLDLSFTAGRSYNEVLAGWNGYTSAGYRFATRDEVLGLFSHAGANPLDAEANRQAASKTLVLLGTTLPQPDSNLSRSWMHYDPATEPALPGVLHVSTAVFGTGEIGGGTVGEQGFFNVPGLFPLRDYASPEIGSALVRVVPEPATLRLLGFAAFLLCCLKRRQ
jgi:hypothetical protein